MVHASPVSVSHQSHQLHGPSASNLACALLTGMQAHAGQRRCPNSILERSMLQSAEGPNIEWAFRALSKAAVQHRACSMLWTRDCRSEAADCGSYHSVGKICSGFIVLVAKGALQISDVHDPHPANNRPGRPILFLAAHLASGLQFRCGLFPLCCFTQDPAVGCVWCRSIRHAQVQQAHSSEDRA